jgi:osmotically-inducible protein OsmY
MQDGRIDASDLEVEVMDGVVMLTGTVDNRQIKRLAEEVVERVPGVTDVQNRVRLRESEQEPHGRESRFGQRERDYR